MLMIVEVILKVVFKCHVISLVYCIYLNFLFSMHVCNQVELILFRD